MDDKHAFVKITPGKLQNLYVLIRPLSGYAVFAEKHGDCRSGA